MTESTPKQEPPYGLRMPPDLKARVKAAAEANNRSMNAEIVAMLEEKFPAMIGETAYMKANAESVAREGYPVHQITAHSTELLMRPTIGAGGTIDPKRFVRTRDGLLFLEVVCLP